MRIGLIDVDGHSFPNLALMKLSAHYKNRGCHVEMAYPMGEYDVVYMNKVFDDTYSKDIDWYPKADDIVRGGTGYGLDNKLSYEVEHTYPDYELYPGLTENTAFGCLFEADKDDYKLVTEADKQIAMTSCPDCRHEVIKEELNL